MSKNKGEISHDSTDFDYIRESVFKSRCMFKNSLISETCIVTRLLNKFSFVNEEILRQQTMNELVYFTNRDRIIDSKLLNTLTSGMCGLSRQFNPNASYYGHHHQQQ